MVPSDAGAGDPLAVAQSLGLVATARPDARWSAALAERGATVVPLGRADWPDLPKPCAAATRST